MILLSSSQLDSGAFLAVAEPWNHVLRLLLSLALLVGGGELFTTGVEWIGHRTGVNESATGSIFAALATTVPETLIPVVAILGTTGATVGVGAIVGGPLMLTTVAPFLLGIGIIVYAKRGDRAPTITIDETGALRDLRVFLVGFGFVLLTVFVASQVVMVVGSALLVAVYGWYLYRTVRTGVEGGDSATVESLEFGKWLDQVGFAGSGESNPGHAENPSNRLIGVQTLIALALIIAGSELFVSEIEWFSVRVLAIPTLITALIGAPLASNTPEGVDGLIWAASERDTIAVDQLTGTLAFQGTVLAAIGIAFTGWDITPQWKTTGWLTTTAIVGSLVSGGLLYLLIRQTGGDEIDSKTFVALGAIYLVFLLLVGYYVLAGYVR